MIEKPVLVQTNAQKIVFIPIVVLRDQVQEVMAPAYQELMDALAGQGVEPAGPWFTHHLRMDPAIFDFRISVPVPRPIEPVGRVQFGELAAAKAAQTVCHGGYEGLPVAWAEFEAWITSQNLTKRPDLWERYLLGPESDPDPSTWQTELNQPIVQG